MARLRVHHRPKMTDPGMTNKMSEHSNLPEQALRRLEDLLERAAKGPWEARFRFGQKTTVGGRQRFPICDTGTAPYGQANTIREEANASLIVEAINALPQLLSTAREAQRLREALRPFAEPHVMGDNYVKFAPRLLEAARAALQPSPPRSER